MLVTVGIIVGIVAGIAGTAGVGYAIYTNPPFVKVTANAQLDATNYLSVALTAGRRGVTITAVRPVVYFDPTGQDSGATQYILETNPSAAIPRIDLTGGASRTVGRSLAMDKQSLPSPDGTGPVVRKPRREEVRVRIDYGKNKQTFVTPDLVDYAIEPHSD